MTQLGLLTGLALGLAVLLDGFSGFAITAVLGGAGLLVGRVLDGQLDLGPVLRGQSPTRR